MASRRFDFAIVGGGILGLALARELILRHPRIRIVVLEKEKGIARHQSGRNSGVIHSGVYYSPGSLKAELCVAGSAQLFQYCARKRIPVERCGKVIVAVTDTEVPNLTALYEKGLANGVEDVRLIGPSELRRIEPSCVGKQALLVPPCGITDYSQVSAAYAEDVIEAGGEIRIDHHVESIQDRNGHVAVRLVSRTPIEADQVVTCAGLQSDLLAQASGGSVEPVIVPFRGDYWLLRRRELIRNLIYPVPDPSLPFLGVHFTRHVGDGSVWIGPNAVFAFAREGYKRFSFRPRELAGAITYRGFQRLVGRYWRTGLKEAIRDISRRALLRDLRRYVPQLKIEDILPGPSGVRAQAVNRDGHLIDDFVFDVQGARILHVRNAPSPAATSSLTIARFVADKVYGLRP